MITVNEDIGYRVKWKNVLLGFHCIMFAVISTWLFYSMSQTDHPDSLLVAFAIITCCFSILFLILTVAGVLRKKVCVKICGEKLILVKYKERIIDFADIENVQYMRSSSGSGGKRSFIGSITYDSGKIIVTLKNKSKVSVDDVKDVRRVCSDIRERVFEE